MSPVNAPSNSLLLEPCAGPREETVVIDGTRPAILGRGGDCRVHLPDPHVSRHHALIVQNDETWTLTDLGSRHGTYLNGMRLGANLTAPLAPGDDLRLEPYVFRVGGGEATPMSAPTEEASIMPTSVITMASEAELRSLPERRLQLLMDGAASIYDVRTEDELARSLLDLLIGGTGFARGLILRQLGSEGPREIMASSDPTQREGVAVSYSSSLAAKAATGQVVKLYQSAGTDLGQSIGQLAIHSAVCCPIMLDGAAAGIIYLDSRGMEADAYPDAAGFCHAVSRLAGLSLASLRRAELQQRQALLERDLQAAQRAQQMLVPPEAGVIEHLVFSTAMRPGRVVAGDVLDVFSIGEGKVVVCAGDVTGHGLGAAILMPAVLSHLRASFESTDDPVIAVSSLNRYLHECSAENMFVTLFSGVFDRGAGTLHYVDAGHGHWLVRPGGEAPRSVGVPGGPPLGIVAELVYESDRHELSSGDRLIVYSDGLIEHQNLEGEEFGLSRLCDVLAGATSTSDEVARSLAALDAHLGSLPTNDDITVASFEITT